jgi:hypothetical protein
MVAVVVAVVVVVVEVADGVVVVATDHDVVVAVVDVAAAAAAGGARSVRMVVHLQRSRSEHLGAAAIFAAAAALAETSARKCAVRASPPVSASQKRPRAGAFLD